MSQLTSLFQFLLGKLFYLILSSVAVFSIFIFSDTRNYSIPAIKGEKNCQLIDVLDGDTVTVICPKVGAFILTIRLQDIDAPEIDQSPWGALSRQQLVELTPKKLRVNFFGKDIYQRYLGVLKFAEQDLNQAMLEKGMARVYQQYHPPKHYLLAMQKARKQQLGIWSVRGLQQDPQRYRRLK